MAEAAALAYPIPGMIVNTQRCKSYDTDKCQLWCEKLKMGKCPYDYRSGDKK